MKLLNEIIFKWLTSPFSTSALFSGESFSLFFGSYVTIDKYWIKCNTSWLFLHTNNNTHFLFFSFFWNCAQGFVYSEAKIALQHFVEHFREQKQFERVLLTNKPKTLHLKLHHKKYQTQYSQLTLFSLSLWSSRLAKEDNWHSNLPDLALIDGCTIIWGVSGNTYLVSSIVLSTTAFSV